MSGRRSSRTTCTPTTCRRATRSQRPEAIEDRRAAPPRARRQRDGRARARRPGDRRRVRRHRLRHRRHDVGRRAAGRRRRRLPRASRRSARCRWPAAIAPSAQPWRIALALLDDAFDGDVPPSAWRALRRASPNGDVGIVRELMRAARERAARARRRPLLRRVRRAVPRAAAVAPSKGRSRSSGTRRPIPRCTRVVSASTSGPTADAVGDRPALRRSATAVDDALSGEPVAGDRGALPQHARRGDGRRSSGARRGVHGRLPVVATGGCFQNARLAESVRAALAPEFDVRLHATVPPGDGGIALGQAVVADAIARGTEAGARL